MKTLDAHLPQEAPLHLGAGVLPWTCAGCRAEMVTAAAWFPRLRQLGAALRYQPDDRYVYDAGEPLHFCSADCALEYLVDHHDLLARMLDLQVGRAWEDADGFVREEGSPWGA